MKRVAASAETASGHRRRRGGRHGKHAAQATPAAPADQSEQRAAPDAVAHDALVPADPAGAGEGISFSNLSLHHLFEQQARTMLDRADIDEEQKQGILVAMNCPCCGAGGLSFSVKLKP